MALAPEEVRYSGATATDQFSAQLVIQSALGGTRTVNASLATRTGFPSGHLGAGSHALTISESTSGIGPPEGVWGLAVVEDDTDVGSNGDYTVTGGVISWTNLGTGGSLTTSINISLPTSGVYRFLLTVGDNADRSQNGSGTNTGPPSSEYHIDSDASSR